MRPRNAFALIFAPILAVPLIAHAQEDSPQQASLEARHGFMIAVSQNMAPLAGMAKGDVPYDEALATYHARQLAALGSYDVSMHVVEGSAEGQIEDSELLPAAVTDLEGFKADFKAFSDATAAAPAGVVGGQENVAAVVQKIGGTCKACHDDYRAK